jgi:hypothetical protein
MATETSNGSEPADADTSTPFERFERLTKHIVNVPKTELDEKLGQEKRKVKTKQAPAK